MSASLSIVVLPFKNLSPNEEYDYFSDGITDSIIQALSSINRLKVISKTSTFYFKDKAFSLTEIAQKLQVSHVLEGSIRIAEKQLKVNVNLVDAESDFSLWSQSWKRDLSQIFEVEDEICLKVAEKLREHAGHLELEESLVSAPTPTLAAYEQYLIGQKLFNKWNPQDVSQAIEELEKALKLDPNLLQAHIALADAYSFMAVTAFAPVEEALQKSDSYLQQAKQLDPNSAELNYLLANDAFFREANYAKALQYSLKSIQTKPTYIDSQRFLIFLYLLNDQVDKAKEHLFYAKSVDPLGAETSFYEGYYHYRTENYEAAKQIMQALLAENSSNIPAITIYLYILILRKEFDELQSYLNSIPEMMLIPDERLGMEALLKLETKDESFQSTFEKVRTNASKQTSKQADSYLYLLLVRQGKFDEAFEVAERIFTHQSSIVMLHFGDPLAKEARISAQFSTLHKRIFSLAVSEPQKVLKKSSELQATEANEAIEKLQLHLSEEQSYLNPQLSLRLLAQEIGIHPNQLSWLLNEKMGKNFNEFINNYRIAHFKQIAAKAENAHISIIGLAFESGFNSKSVFNTFFKKVEGITPKTFLSQLKQSSSDL